MNNTGVRRADPLAVENLDVTLDSTVALCDLGTPPTADGKQYFPFTVGNVKILGIHRADLIETHLCVRGPAQFKPVSFKGQLDF